MSSKQNLPQALGISEEREKELESFYERISERGLTPSEDIKAIMDSDLSPIEKGYILFSQGRVDGARRAAYKLMSVFFTIKTRPACQGKISYQKL